MARGKTQEKSKGDKLSENFRTVAGLPEREGKEPTSPSEVGENNLRTEPEGGYGGEGGIDNTASINASERQKAAGETGTSVVDSEAPDAEGDGDETGVVDTEKQD